jgi:cytochrome P450
MTTSEAQSGGCPVAHGAALEETSLTDPAILAHHGDFFRAVREQDPVHYDAKLGMYLISRFDDIQTVQRDPITFSVERGYNEQYAKGFVEEFREILIRDGGGYFPDAIMTDPPYHTRIRRLLDKAFTAHRMKELEPTIAALVGNMIDKLAERGGCDAISEFAVPMTSSIICEQLGLDNVAVENVQRWSHAVTQQIGRTQKREDMIHNARNICELQNYLIANIRERETNRRDDMISDLVHARTEDDANPTLNFEETVSLVRAFLIAGNETTATALGNLFFILATWPEVARQLYDNVNDERFLNRFVEELLRIEPPVRALSRMTTKEVELGGKVLPEGAHLLLVYASANDDEKEFSCPRNFDTERTNLGRHVAFGGGVHRCIGAALARMEIKVAAREIVKRLENIKLAIPAEEVTYLPTVATHSIARLPVTFSRRQ